MFVTCSSRLILKRVAVAAGAAATGSLAACQLMRRETGVPEEATAGVEILVHNLSHADLIVKISDGVPSPSGVHEYKVRPHIHGISVTASLCRCSHSSA